MQASPAPVVRRAVDATALDRKRAGSAAALSKERSREAPPPGGAPPLPAHRHDLLLVHEEAADFARAAHTMLRWKGAVVPFERCRMCAPAIADRFVVTWCCCFRIERCRMCACVISDRFVATWCCCFRIERCRMCAWVVSDRFVATCC